MLYLSKIIKTDKNNFIYDAVSNKLINIDAEILEQLELNMFNKKYYDFLTQNKIRDLTKPLNFEIEYTYSDEEVDWLTKNRAKSLTLALTEQCNLRCVYCAYMPKYLDKTYKLKHMAEDIAIKSIDIFMRAAKQNPSPSIGFYGGEPLLQFELIKKCVGYCKEKYPFSKPSFDITTNGLLLDNENIVNFLIENEFTVAVSLDGPQDIHDKFRKDVNNKPSFEKIVKNLTQLYHKAPKYFKNKISFNAVITPLTGSKEQFEFLDKLYGLDVFPIEVAQSDYFSEYLNNVNQTEVSSLNRNFDKMNYSVLRKGILKELAQYHTLYTNGLYNSGQSCLKVFPGGFCVPGSHRIFVSTEGKLIICERVDDLNKYFCIGDVDNGIDTTKLNQLLTITKKNIDKCKYCWAAKLCDICFKDIFGLTDEFCESKKQGIEAGITYYLNNFKDNKEITNMLENFV